MNGYKYVVTTKSRHGKVVRYYRPPGCKKVRLHAEPDTPEFDKEYVAARNGTPPAMEVPKPANRNRPGPIKVGSLRWLVHRYYDHSAYKDLCKDLRVSRRTYLENICDSIHPEKQRARGELPYAGLKRVNVLALHETISDKPSSADSHVRALGVVYNWAMKMELATFNPVFDLDWKWTGSDGHHTWTPAEMSKYEKRWKLGTMERLAFDLMLYAGVRQSDAIRLGPQHDRDGALHFTEWKNGHSEVKGKHRRQPKHRIIAIHPALRASIAATSHGDLVYLLHPKGKPFNRDTFDRWFGKATAGADIPHCTAHGIRKGGATELANSGASPDQLMGLYGWTKYRTAETYTKAADRAKLAAAAVKLLGKRRRKG